ncbi:hypothetical protein C8R44DRAFT_858666 [Mycena epipterygia]|nr:hypothetical protein C8R44DRAFT_858666 [Mycena epipterygia]
MTFGRRGHCITFNPPRTRRVRAISSLWRLLDPSLAAYIRHGEFSGCRSTIESRAYILNQRCEIFRSVLTVTASTLNWFSDYIPIFVCLMPIPLPLTLFNTSFDLYLVRHRLGETTRYIRRRRS